MGGGEHVNSTGVKRQINPETTLVVCANCSRPFGNMDQLGMHQPFCKRTINCKMHEFAAGGDCKSIEGNFNFSRELKFPISNHSQQTSARTSVIKYKFMCYYCEFVFYSEQHYLEHMSLFRYECKTCHSHFETNHLLKTHYCLKFLKDLRTRMANSLLKAVKTQKRIKEN